MDVFSYIARFLRTSIINVFSPLFCVLPSLLKILLRLLQQWSLDTCSFLYTFACILSSSLEMLFCHLSFLFSTSFYNLFSLLFGLLGQTSFSTEGCGFCFNGLFGLSDELFGLKSFFPQLLFCLGNLCVYIGGSDFADFICDFVK